MKTKTPVSRKNNIIIQEYDDEVLIYDLIKNEAFCLNATSAFIWKMCDGKNTCKQIGKELNQKFKTEVDDGFVWLALDQLKKNELIENEPEMPQNLSGLSRRQIIRQIGLGSMVALPIVSSIISPTAVHAQSCLTLETTCSTAPQCCPTVMNCNSLTVGGMACCAPGSGPDAPSGTIIGPPITSPTMSCPQVTPGANAACAPRGPQCCPGVAIFSPGSCVNPPGPVDSSYTCECQ